MILFNEFKNAFNPVCVFIISWYFYLSFQTIHSDFLATALIHIMALESTHYDFIALGCGIAGLRCAVIERQWLGGSCPNVACLPSKNFVHSANVVHDALHLDNFGLPTLRLARDGGDLVVQMAAIRERKREMVRSLIQVHENNFRSAGTDIIWGEVQFVGEKKIEVRRLDGKKMILTADKIVISTGSRAKIPDIPGIKEAKPLTHIEFLELDVVPRHLVVLGGGYSGLEFAQAIRRLGAEVTIIEQNAQVLKREDKDIITALMDILQEEGIRIITSAIITSVTGISGSAVTLTCDVSDSRLTISASHILCASGRIPNTDNIGLDKAGVAVTSRGFIVTNETLETTNPGVYAVGDCAGSPFFTHIGYDDFRIVRDTLLSPSKPVPANRRSGRQVPFTLFTSPELAHVGMREREAAEAGVKVRVARMPMAAFLKTRTLGHTAGFAKTLVGENDEIFGFTALGDGVGELLPVVQLAMRTGLKYTDIADLIISHPTLGEGLMHLFEEVPRK